jgi:hypothetical protein
MNIWQFQNLVSRRLLRWGVMSVIIGLLMRFGSKFWKNLGNQFIAWGAIDVGIAVGGQISARNLVDNIENPGLPEVKQEERKNLGRLLWINAGLDILYMLWGLRWLCKESGDGADRGNGLGVLIQGAFLFAFDLIHARNLPDEDK